MSAEEAGKAFSAKCDALINEHPNNAELENAVIELEVCHTTHINAIKREFNAQLDSLEAEEAAAKARYEARAAEDKEFFDREIKRIAADYQKQLHRAREAQQADVKRLKDSLETLSQAQGHSSAVVTQMQEDHRKEVTRLKDEHERIVGNKDREIARLNRRLDEGLGAVDSVVESSEQRRRASMAEAGLLRRDVMSMQVDRNQMEQEYQEQIRKLVDRQEMLMRTSATILNEFQDRAAELELALSKLRASQLDEGYEKVRAKLANAADDSDRRDIDEDMERLVEQKTKEREDLSALVEKARKTRESHADTVTKFQAELEDEMNRLREMRKKTLEQSTAQRRRAYSLASTPSGTYALPTTPESETKRGRSSSTQDNAEEAKNE